MTEKKITEDQMLIEQGIVVDLKNDTVWVQTLSKTSCNSCKVNSSCGTGIVSKAFGERSFITPMKNQINAELKDSVEVGIPDDLVIKSSLLVYMLPLLAMIIVIIVVKFLAPNLAEPWLIASAIMGLVIGFVTVKKASLKMNENSKLEPVLLRIVSRPIDVKQIETS